MTTALRSAGVLLLVGMVCGAVWAGNVSVLVQDGAVAVSGAMVRIEPGGVNGTTNAAGKWTAPGLDAGNYRAISWKTIGGALRGAIANVTVPAGGNVAVTLNYTDAIWTYDYFPYGVGNAWQYRYRSVGPEGTTTGTRRDRVDRATTVDGEPAVVLAASHEGGTEWEDIRASNRNWFALYTSQDGDDVIKFDPPLKIGPLLPLGYEWVVGCTAHHSDGSPDQPAQLRVKFVGYNATTVPAGAFPEAARLDVVQTMGGATNNMRLWMGYNVGIVRQNEVKPDRTTAKVLEEYRIVAVPLRPVRPLRPGPLLPH